MTTRTKTNRRRLVLAAAAAAIAIVVVGLAAGIGGTTPATETRETIDASFTYFDGSEGSLSDLRGRPLVVNFWASWCPPCVAEMPDLQEVFTEYDGRVDFLGFNMQELDFDAALRLVDQTGVTYPLAHDPDGSIYRDFGGIAMPTTVLISEQGEVVRLHGGILTIDQLSGMIEDDLLGS